MARIVDMKYRGDPGRQLVIRHARGLTRAENQMIVIAQFECLSQGRALAGREYYFFDAGQDQTGSLRQKPGRFERPILRGIGTDDSDITKSCDQVKPADRPAGRECGWGIEDRSTSGDCGGSEGGRVPGVQDIEIFPAQRPPGRNRVAMIGSHADAARLNGQAVRRFALQQRRRLLGLEIAILASEVKHPDHAGQRLRCGVPNVKESFCNCTGTAMIRADWKG